jgi:CRISPR-associated protein Csm5
MTQAFKTPMTTVRVRATALSPVHVWGGQAALIEPYLYALDGEWVRVLSEHRLIDVLAVRGVLEEYLEAVEGGPQSARRAVARFVDERVLSLESCTLHRVRAGREFRNAYRDERDTRTPYTIQALPRGMTGAYLPGSSIKGAIRTALLSDQSVTKLNGHNLINDQGFWRREKIEADDGQISPNRPRSDANTAYEAFVFDNLIERRGKLKPDIGRDPLRVLEVGDTSQLPEGGSSVEVVDVWSASPRHSQFERTYRVALREVMQTGANLEFVLRFDTAFQQHARTGLKYKPTLEDVIGSCQDFYNASAHVDLDFFEAQGRRSSEAREAAVTTGNIIDQIQNLGTKRIFPLRLGMGSGRAGTTLVELFDERSYERSVSRKLAAGQPMGWLMCEVIA